jgi:Flp pilus assembly pilin Flp
LGGDAVKKSILVVLRTLHHDESAQDLIEYALVALLISCAAVATMSGLATVITSAYVSITAGFGG